MNMDKRPIFLLALTIGMAAGTVFAMRFRRQNQLVAQNEQQRLNLRAWENEGGNLAPVSASPAAL